MGVWGFWFGKVCDAGVGTPPPNLLRRFDSPSRGELSHRFGTVPHFPREGEWGAKKCPAGCGAFWGGAGALLPWSALCRLCVVS